MGDVTATSGCGSRPADDIGPKNLPEVFDCILNDATKAQLVLSRPTEADQDCVDYYGPLTKKDQARMDSGQCTPNMQKAKIDTRNAAFFHSQVSEASEKLKNLPSDATTEQINAAWGDLKNAATAYKAVAEVLSSELSNAAQQTTGPARQDMKHKADAADEIRADAGALAWLVGG